MPGFTFAGKGFVGTSGRNNEGLRVILTTFQYFGALNGYLFLGEIFVVKLLFIGDIVGKPGRRIVKRTLHRLAEAEEIDLVVANGENSAGGFGINVEVCRELLGAGIDIITMGNHTWDNREINQLLEVEDRVIRPANYPEGTPGVGFTAVETAKGVSVGIINLMGQVFLEPLACPFRTVDLCIGQLKRKTNLILVDVHAEATSEKIALGRYLDGRVTAVLGTHTHVTTADERILPMGTAYITDVGMTGPTESVLGIKADLVIQKFLTKRPVRFEVAGGVAELNAVVVEADEYGLATSIRRIRQSIAE
jgi:metallophosphoesterase (TIGR00282 family)